MRSLLKKIMVRAYKCIKYICMEKRTVRTQTKLKIVVTYGEKSNIVGWTDKEEILHIVLYFYIILLFYKNLSVHYYKI